MGKTFRRGGSEYGNNSYGKSLRDKRAKGSKRYSKEDSYGKKVERKYEYKERRDLGRR